MKDYIPSSLRTLVIKRANSRCEYCGLHQDVKQIYSHEIDHIIAEKHGGETNERNLAYACFYCNRFKGTDLASVDPLTGIVTPLFDPRNQVWDEHFALDGPLILPLRADD